MTTRRELLTAAAMLAALPNFAWGARQRGIRPGIFSFGQSQAGQGGASPPRTGPGDTDTVARLADKLLMFAAPPELNGNVFEGVERFGPGEARPARALDAAAFSGFAPYRDAAGETTNASTPFLFALAALLDARGLIPVGMFGFTAWQGGAKLNAFLPPGDPDYRGDRLDDAGGERAFEQPTNYANLVAAMRRYAELTRAEGLRPYIPMLRIEHGEGRIAPSSQADEYAEEKARYVAAHLRLTDALIAEVRRITGQRRDPIFLLGGWGGTDTSNGFEDVPQEAVKRLTALRPERYVGPTSSVYMAPLYADGGATSSVHPSFRGRVLVGEIQAQVANFCLDDRLTPSTAAFSPFRCIGIARVPGLVATYDLTYHRPPAAEGSIAFAVDDDLPEQRNQGFEYRGRDAEPIRIRSVAIVGEATIRIALSAEPTDPAGQIVYALVVRDPAFVDGRWNRRGNLVLGTTLPFFYGPILQAAPYEQPLPARQRYVAIPQRIDLPR